MKEEVNLNFLMSNAQSRERVEKERERVHYFLNALIALHF